MLRQAVSLLFVNGIARTSVCRNYLSHWTRPDSIPFPTTWRRFNGKRPVNGKVPRFRVQDVTDDLTEDVIKFISKYMFTYEPTMIGLKFNEDTKSVHEIQTTWLNLIKKRLSLVALLDDTTDSRQQIVACNVLQIENKDGEKLDYSQYSGKCMRDFIKMICQIEHSVDPFQLYNVNEYISGFGLVVDPAFSGQGVSEEMFKARFEMGRRIGVHLTVTAFSNVRSQIQAERAGFEVINKVLFKDFELESNTDVFSNTPADQYWTLMAAKL